VSRRRWLSLVLSVLFVVPSLASCATKSDRDAAQDIRLYQVLPVARKSKLVQEKGQGEAFAIVNTGAKPRYIRGWVLQSNVGSVLLPAATVKPGQILYVADDAEYFKKYWNFTPDFEFGQDTDVAVPDLRLPEQKVPVMNDEADVIRLYDDQDKLADILVYGSVGNPPSPWTGPPVQYVNSFPLTPANQVFTRMHQGGTFTTEPKATAWSGGTPTDPRRVYFAGQSDFAVRSVTGTMNLIAASAPDNAGPVLYELVDSARVSVRLAGYQFTAEELTRRLIAAAKRGVKVQVAIERNPGGSDMFESDKEVHQRLVRGGVGVLYYWKWDGDLSSRVNPLHSKYGIFDDETVLVASGNWINSVYNTDPSCGNREWIAVIKANSEVTRLVREVWDFDIGSGSPEVRPWNEKMDAPRMPDDYDAGPCLKYTPVKPRAVAYSGRATVTRILSPDNTFDRESGFLGLLRGAKRELLISANYINKWWGAAGDASNLTRYPQPYLQEIIAAARRGVNVMVILDRRGVKLDSLRDNHYVVQYLNDLAQKENLKLQARLINMDASGVGRTYHNKSLIVDDAVVISSINGSENSFRYARELALKFEGIGEFTQYYRDLFRFDWDASARPNFPWNVIALPRTSGTFVDWSANAELDVVRYEVHYKPTPAGSWTRLGVVDRPGFEDTHTTGVWGVVAVNRQGGRSNYAEVSR